MIDAPTSHTTTPLMAEFIPLTSIMAAIQHEVSVVFMLANHLSTVKTRRMLPAENEAAYTFFSFLPCYESMDWFIDDLLTF